MLALLAALTVTAAPATPAKIQPFHGADLRTPKCDPSGMLHTQSPALLWRPGDPGKASPLGNLPPARAEYTVMRMVEGCAVPAPVGYRQPPVRPAGEPSNRR